MDEPRAPELLQKGPNPGVIAACVIGGAAFLGVVLMVVLFLPTFGKGSGHPKGLDEMVVARTVVNSIIAYEQSNGAPLPLEGWKETLIAESLIEPDFFESQRYSPRPRDYFYVPPSTMGTSTPRGNAVLVYLHPDTFEDIGVLVDSQGIGEILDKGVFTTIISGMQRPDGTPFAPHTQP